MPIDPICHQKLKQLGLPMEVELIDKFGNVVAVGVININGSVSSTWPDRLTFEHPSWFRDRYIGSDLPTYPSLRQVGTTQSLRDRGVHR